MPLPHFSPDPTSGGRACRDQAHDGRMKRGLAVLVVLLTLGVGPATSGSPPAPRWAWPTPAPHAVVRQYLAPATPYGPGHRGLDVASPATAISAPADGVVHFAGVVVDRPVLSIAHEGGFLSSYEPLATTLVAGDTVTRGQLIGTLEPGHCGPVLCLHFGVRLDGQYVNPLLLLGGVPRSVLLPTR